LRAGHSDRVTCIAISRDGTTLASGQITHMGYLAEIILWDISGLADGSSAPTLLKRLRLHKVAVQALDFSYNGKYLASVGGSDDNNLVIWNVANGKAICGSPAAHDTALTVKWMNTSDLSLVTGGMKALRMWSLDPENRKVRPMEVSTRKEVRTYTCLAVAPDDSVLYCGTTTGDVMVVSAEKQTLITQGPPKGASLGCGVQAISVNGDELLVGSGDGELVTLDLADPQLRPKCVQKVLGAVSSLAMDSAGEFFFAGTEKSNMYLVQYEGLVAELKTTCHAEHINDVAFPRGYAELFATCAGSDIRIWHSGTLSELLRVQVPNQECNCIAFIPTGTAIVSGWNDGKIRSFLPQSGGLQYVINESHRLTGVGNSSGGVVPKNGVTSICPSNDCKRLLSGGADGQVRVWAISKGTQVMIASMKEHKGPIYAISIKADDSECVSASADGSCITWSLTDLQPFVRINALFAANFFKSVCYHPDESQLLTCGTDRKITYWDVVNMNAIRIIDGSETAEVNSLSVNPDGKFFVSGGSDKKVTLWNYDEGSKYYVGEGHSGSVSMVTISPDQKRIISVGTEGGIFIWTVPDEFM
jgi:WD40 repeat protein